MSQRSRTMGIAARCGLTFVGLATLGIGQSCRVAPSANDTASEAKNANHPVAAYGIMIATCRIDGVARDSRTNQPIPGLTVRVLEHKMVTDASGNFTFTIPDPIPCERQKDLMVFSEASSAYNQADLVLVDQQPRAGIFSSLGNVLVVTPKLSGPMPAYGISIPTVIPTSNP